MAEEPGHGEIGSSVRFLKMEDFCLGKKKKMRTFLRVWFVLDYKI